MLAAARCPSPRMRPFPPVWLLQLVLAVLSRHHSPVAAQSCRWQELQRDIDRNLGCERVRIKASETRLLVNISLLQACRAMKYSAANLKEAMMHSCFIAWYRWNIFREYILSFNEPTAQGPGFISPSRILSFFQVLIFHFLLSLFPDCVCLKHLGPFLQLLCSLCRCLCSPQEFLNLVSLLPLTAMGKTCCILAFLSNQSKERETFPCGINILPWQACARMGPLCAGKQFPEYLVFKQRGAHSLKESLYHATHNSSKGSFLLLCFKPALQMSFMIFACFSPLYSHILSLQPLILDINDAKQ